MKEKVPFSEGLATRVKTTKTLLEINDTISLRSVMNARAKKRKRGG